MNKKALKIAIWKTLEPALVIGGILLASYFLGWLYHEYLLKPSPREVRELENGFKYIMYPFTGAMFTGLAIVVIGYPISFFMANYEDALKKLEGSSDKS